MSNLTGTAFLPLGSRWLEQIAAVLIWAMALLVMGFFAWLFIDIIWHSLDRISWSFLLDLPQNAGREGGIGSILAATGLILLVCLAVAVPISVGAAIFLAEFTRTDNPFGRFIGYSLDVLAGVPSIVFGLFGNAFFCIYLGMGFSILSGGLTLACMILPLLIRATEEGFRSVPLEYRLGAAALGMTRSSTLWHLLLPSATPGLVVGLILGIGRAMAETAALIFTSGYVDRMPASLHDSGRALSLHIYDLAMNVPGGTATAYASALVLIALLVLINGIANWLARRWLQRKIMIL